MPGDASFFLCAASKLTINNSHSKGVMIADMKTNQLSLFGITLSQTSPGIRRLMLLLPAACLLLAGCKNEPAPGKPAASKQAIDGTYALVKVDGKDLPCTIKHGDAPITIKSGAFTINADGTCGSKMNFSVASRPEATREVKATYTCEGSKLNMSWEGAGQTVGNVEGNTFTMENEGTLLTYKK
jgi:hypothetical protein